MPEIHPTSIIDGDVTLADDVVIGPGCVLTGPLTLGAGTRLLGNVYLQGPLEMGAGNLVYPFACLGFAPQHAKFDPQTPGRGTVIGDDNTFRESVTIHRAFTDEGPTRVGDRNVFMVNSHVGHDSLVANDCTLVNGALVAGHCELHDRVILGGNSSVHQFVRVGRGSIVSGLSGAASDVPPHFLVTGIDWASGVNLVGMRRSEMTRDEIETVRWVYRTLYRRGLSLAGALEAIRERSGEPLIDEYVTFIESAKRGICQGRLKEARTPAHQE